LGSRLHTHLLPTLSPVGGEWSASHPDRFTPRRKSFLYHTAGPDITIQWLELRSLGRAARGQSQYPLLSHGSGNSGKVVAFALYEPLITGTDPTIFIWINGRCKSTATGPNPRTIQKGWACTLQSSNDTALHATSGAGLLQGNRLCGSFGSSLCCDCVAAKDRTVLNMCSEGRKGSFPKFRYSP
jgi:hypothetical protein